MRHTACAQRQHYEMNLHYYGGLDQLRRAMPIWARGARLDPAVFQQTFFGPYDSPKTTALLQSAAREAATAQPRLGLRPATADLAGAVQDVGIYNWPPFLATAGSVSV